MTEAIQVPTPEPLPNFPTTLSLAIGASTTRELQLDGVVAYRVAVTLRTQDLRELSTVAVRGDAWSAFQAAWSDVLRQYLDVLLAAPRK